MSQNIVIEFIDMNEADAATNNVLNLNNKMQNNIHVLQNINEIPKVGFNNADGRNDHGDIQNNTTGETISGKLTRKRKVNESSWKCNIRKSKFQSGQSYISKRGKFVPEKKIVDKKNCINDCKYKCGQLISEDERKSIFNSYYKLDQIQKYHFLLRTTERHLKSRVYPKKENSRRQFSFKYFFDLRCDRFQVCKNFYLGTLSISQKPVYNVHKNKNSLSNVPAESMRGKGSGRKLKEEDKLKVLNHIEKFPRIPSHYCRADTKKEYLESNLNIKKMYRLYVQECNNEKKVPVKENMYWNLFCTEFNIDFHKPKKDLCIVCEKINFAEKENKEVSLEDVEKFNKHKEMKIKMREEKERDKKGDIPVLSFDLENVITLPRTNIGNFFYLHKLTCFNLTGHVSKTKVVYNALWNESISGRSGNDIASALLQILERLVSDNKNITEIITWSDSCVPQNRNSIMAYAVLSFLKRHSQVNTITMKFSVPGHSAIQEVDNAHSQIEHVLKQNDIFSPVSLLTVLKTVNEKFKFIEMIKENFFDFGCCKGFEFKKIPFTKVVELRFTQVLSVVEYKTDYGEIEYTRVSIKREASRSTRKIANLEAFPNPKAKISRPIISDEKRTALKSMMDLMPEEDKMFYKKNLKI